MAFQGKSVQSQSKAEEAKVTSEKFKDIQRLLKYILVNMCRQTYRKLQGNIILLFTVVKMY